MIVSKNETRNSHYNSFHSEALQQSNIEQLMSARSLKMCTPKFEIASMPSFNIFQIEKQNPELQVITPDNPLILLQ